mgnify:CR=1 FL=1
MNILQRIFTNYYEEIKYTLHHKSSEIENIEKMINCGDPYFGGAMYGYPHCGNLKSVPFATTAVSVPLAVTSIPWNVLHLCLSFFRISRQKVRKIRKKVTARITWAHGRVSIKSAMPVR